MLCKLRENGFVIDSEVGCFIMKALDPEGVANRSAKRLNRRTYRSSGPNHIWNIDAYEKLKAFGRLYMDVLMVTTEGLCVLR